MSHAILLTFKAHETLELLCFKNRKERGIKYRFQVLVGFAKTNFDNRNKTGVVVFSSFAVS